MGELVRKFATRVILLHLLGLLAVVALVLGAALQIYNDTRKQAVAQAIARQELLAGQTSRAVADFFDSILDNLDLVRRSEGSEQLTPRERQEPPQFRRRNEGPISPELERLREEARARARELRLNLSPNGPRPAQRPDRPEATPTTRHGPLGLLPTLPPSLTQLALGQLGPDLSRPRPQPPQPGQGGGGGGGSGGGNPQLSTLLWRQLESRASHLFSFDPANSSVTELGRSADAVPTPDIARLVRADLLPLDRPTVTDVRTLTDTSHPPHADRSFVVVAAPVLANDRQRRILAAAVPVSTVTARFLDELAADPTVGYALFDAHGTLVASSGQGLPLVTRAALTSAGATSRPHAPTTRAAPPSAVHTDSFILAAGLPARGSTAALPPSIVVLADVDLEGPDWTLVIASPLSEVDTLLAGVVRRSMFWAAFLVLATAGLLVSTSARLIRDRIRLEREQQAALRRDLDQARKIQLEWLPPDFAPTPRLALHALNVPASHVSGDLYNWFRLPGSGDDADGPWVLVIGDVTGHGLAAAMQMSSVQLLVRAAMRVYADPGAALEQVNATLCLHDFSGQFVTLLIAVLDPDRGTLALASAGHPAPLLSSPTGYRTLDIEPELMLGVDPSATYPTQRFDLAPSGDSAASEPVTLVLYTDGLPEAMNPNHDLFSMSRVLDTLNAAPAGTPAAACAALTAAVDAFRGPRPLGDDLTLLAVRLSPHLSDRPAPSAPPEAKMPPPAVSLT